MNITPPVTNMILLQNIRYIQRNKLKKHLPPTTIFQVRITCKKGEEHSFNMPAHATFCTAVPSIYRDHHCCHPCSGGHVRSHKGQVKPSVLFFPKWGRGHYTLGTSLPLAGTPYWGSPRRPTSKDCAWPAPYLPVS